MEASDTVAFNTLKATKSAQRVTVTAKAATKPGANELAEIWRAAASLERLDGKHKELLGEALLKMLEKSPVPTYGFWSLTRLGARALFEALRSAYHNELPPDKRISSVHTFALVASSSGALSV